MFRLRFPQDTPEHTRSYYAATIAHPRTYPRLETDISTDVVVIGGGFSGVNTALELAERGYSVVLLEANRLCWGASGRNGGQVIGGLGHEPERFRSTLGDIAIDAIHAMGDECVDIIRERVAQYSIDCDLRWGYCDVALNRRHLRWFEHKEREERQRNAPHSLVILDRSEIRDFVGSDTYIGGLYNPTGAGQVHPIDLCLGEAEAARSHGAQIFEQSRALRIQRGERVQVATATGSVSARYLVLCANAYLQNLVPELGRKSLPASSCIITTEPLSAEIAESVLPRDIAACDPRAALDYFRMTNDRRLMFGGLCNYTGLVPDDYEAIMRRKMVAIFPQLGDVAIEYAWDGLMSIGLNRMPQVGMLEDNIFYMQAYAGHGVAPTHLMARLTAEAVAGESQRLQLLSRIRHRPFPGGRLLRRPGFALGMLYFKARDWF